ncbi:hypothetical protein APHAL10511_005805 [Amanita phalloides]|nr:hypothetical protein APHAL10511_005805 [Amanita phalloides]
MREEVGRSIGLSARKVQIWFQNQRQKARRPGGQSEASCRGRPQYGAFSSAPPVPEYGNQLSFNTRPDVNSLPLIQLASSSSQSLQPTGDYVSTPESYSTLSDTPSQLLGPGVPGLHMRPRGAPLGGSSSSTSISLPQMDQLDVNYPATRSVHRNSPPNSPNSVHLLPPPLSVPSHLQDAYPTLPPLMGLQTRASASPPGGPVQSLPGHLSLIETQPGTMDRPFIHYRPASPRAVATPASSSATPGSIPPPFTLQPRPQWDRRSFTPSLARSNLWSSPSSNRSSVSPTQPFFIPSARSPHMSSVSTPNLGRHDATEPIGEKTDWDAQPMASQTPPSSQSRVGRYDPVRATVIPFPTALPPPPRSPSDTEHMKDRS